MPDNSASTSHEAERAELEAVAEALARSPRLSRLVRYLGEKYFQGESDQLHEYNIATEVFGRSKTAFDAGEDAIARVEAHRLRKRLKEYYETEGKDHAVQLSIPSGTYVPVFSHRAPEAAPSSTIDPLQDQNSVAFEAEGTRTGEIRKDSGRELLVRLRRSGWLYFLLTAGLVIAAVGIYLAAHLGILAKGAGTGTATAQP
jgi:hypothetical protein